MTVCLAQNVGVDISKDFLDIAFFPPAESWRFSNDNKGFRALLKRLGKRMIERIVYEPTGAYHRLFERTLAEAHLPLVKVNPRHARRFAQASGKLAKTDRCDAAMLARMGAALQLEPHCVVSNAVDALEELQIARDALVKDRVAALNRKKTARSELIKTQLGERLRQIDAQIKEIEREQKKLRNADPALRQNFDILDSVPSLGAVTANALLAEMPELGHLGEEQASALVGLAPIAEESGKHKGKRTIGGGRARVRQALYMPALNAIKPNGIFHKKFMAMIDAGKPAKVAITAIMRKMLILANALIRDQRKWTPTPP